MLTPLATQELVQRLEVLTKLYETMNTKKIKFHILFQNKGKKTQSKSKLFALKEISDFLINRVDDFPKILKVNLISSKISLLYAFNSQTASGKILNQNYEKELETLQNLVSKKFTKDLDYLDDLFLQNKTPKL